MHHGALLVSGTPDEIRANERWSASISAASTEMLEIDDLTLAYGVNRVVAVSASQSGRKRIEWNPL